MLGKCLLLCAVSLALGQTWNDGDNSTVAGCSSQCSADDDDLGCWNKTLMFFEKTLIGQLRHYIAVQVDIDQWHRRHGMKDGEDFDKLREEVRNTFVSQLHGDDDVLNEDTVTVVANTLVDRISNYSDRVISWIPHYQCPLPCEYHHDSYRNLFIASIILNVLLLIAVVPFIVRLLRSEDDWTKETLIPTARQ